MTTKSTILRRTLKATALTGAMAVLAVVGLQTSASASYTRHLYIPDAGSLAYGKAQTTTVNEDYFLGCDTYTDGWGIYGRFILNTGTTVDVPDPDGNGGVCGSSDYRSTPYYATRLQCIRRDGLSSSWLYTDGLGGN